MTFTCYRLAPPRCIALHLSGVQVYRGQSFKHNLTELLDVIYFFHMYGNAILELHISSVLIKKPAISLHCVFGSKNTMFSTLEFKSKLGERGRPLCMHSGVVWTMGRRGKKHTCLQINWFGQEACKEELSVVKQACGEAGMSQQKHHRVHREIMMSQRQCTQTHTRICIHIYTCTYAVLHIS